LRLSRGFTERNSDIGPPKRDKLSFWLREREFFRLSPKEASIRVKAQVYSKTGGENWQCEFDFWQ